MIATGSKLQTLLVCVGAAVLPMVKTSSAASRAGTEAHERELAPWVAGGTSDTRLGEQLSAVPLPAGVDIEVAFALDVRGAGSARQLHIGGHRDYSAVGADEIALTADVAGPGCVAELKTGQVWVAPIQHNAQVLAGALAVWWRWGDLPEAVLVQAGRPLRVERRRLDVETLLRFQRRLQHLVADVREAREQYARGAEPDLVVGDHCGRCAALLLCPAIGRVLGDDPAAVYAETSATIARAKKRRDLALTVIGAGPAALPDGRHLERQERWHRVYDHDRVRELLTDFYGHETADGLAQVTYRTGVLDEWADQQPHLGQNKRARREALNQLLSARGALRHEPRYVYRTVDAPVEQPGEDAGGDRPAIRVAP